ncbi:universal stress protein UspA [Caloramator quimbayensis]|nr:universal stress protein UspA [Caloramator quimbayensis]
MKVYMTDDIMVCVTQQRTCERLINKGAILKEKYGSNLYVIHVAKEGTDILGSKDEGNALEYLFDISKGVGADLTVLKSRDIVEAIAEFAVRKNIGHIILGEPPKEYKNEGIIAELKSKLPLCRFYIIPANELV